MAEITFLVHTSKGRLMFESTGLLESMDEIVRRAGVVAGYVTSRQPEEAECDGWSVDIRDAAGELIMTLPCRSLRGGRHGCA